MEWNLVLLVMVASSCGMNLLASARARPRAWGYAGKSAVILAITGLAYALRPDRAGWIGGGLLLGLVVLPGLAQRLVHRWTLAQRYDLARWPATVAGLLHPFDGVGQQARLIRGVDQAERGDTAGAEATLAPLARASPRVARAAQYHLCRIGHRWAEWLDWADAHVPADQARRDPTVVVGYVRALGETGRLTDMLYAAAGQRLPGHPMMSVYRALCRLPPFAFAGQVDRAAELLDGPLSRLPAGTRAVWLATAELSAGETDAATARLAAAGPAAKPGTRAAMVHRLAQPPAVAVLSPVDVLMLDQLHRDARHEATYAGGGGPVPWVTYALITANVAMFAVECALGGWADDSDRYDQMLRQLGALSRGTLDAGQYWRLLTANFLHFGSAHIALNMLALLALGPAVERALGRLPFAALYLLSGVLAVWTAAARMADPGEILLGASGAIMGIIGATAAVQARGWLRERAAVAARRLRMVVVIVLLQAAFDYFTPQVSGTAHLAGAAYGFVLASLLPHGRGKRRAIAASVPAAA